MILVTLGTQDKKFTRLLEEIDRLIEKGVITDQVIVQAGYSSNYKSKNMQIFDLIRKDEFDKLIKDCSLLITHAGVGNILTGLKYKKKIIAVPRLKEYKEHVNNHQLEITNTFNSEGYIIGINDVKELKGAILKIKKFKPKKFISNNDKALSIIKELIDK